MKSKENISGYKYENSDLNESHQYLFPSLLNLLDALNLDPNEKQIFELGCGNGAIANALAEHGYTVVGVDPSTEGIRQANSNYPNLHLKQGSAYEDLAAIHGQFPVVISLEVVEHVYAPRDYATTLFSLVRQGGSAIVSTPYHGYLKNLALAITGKMDAHFTALWDNGHIKFWSENTLSELLTETGFNEIEFHRVGRISPIAKSMIAHARK